MTKIKLRLSLVFLLFIFVSSMVFAEELAPPIEDEVDVMANNDNTGDLPPPIEDEVDVAANNDNTGDLPPPIEDEVVPPEVQENTPTEDQAQVETPVQENSDVENTATQSTQEATSQGFNLGPLDYALISLLVIVLGVFGYLWIKNK